MTRAARRRCRRCEPPTPRAPLPCRIVRRIGDPALPVLGVAPDEHARGPSSDSRTVPTSTPSSLRKRVMRIALKVGAAATIDVAHAALVADPGDLVGFPGGGHLERRGRGEELVDGVGLGLGGEGKGLGTERRGGGERREAATWEASTGRNTPRYAPTSRIVQGARPNSTELKTTRKVPNGWPRHCGRNPMSTTWPRPCRTSSAAAWPWMCFSPRR